MNLNLPEHKKSSPKATRRPQLGINPYMSLWGPGALARGLSTPDVSCEKPLARGIPLRKRMGDGIADGALRGPMGS